MRPILSVIRSRPANMNPAAAISAHDVEVTSYSFGIYSAYFGRDLDQRSAAARTYLKSRSTLKAKLKRMLLK